MSEVKVTTGSAAFIEVLDEAVIQDIYTRLAPLEDKTTSVQFRPVDKTIALVFSDSGIVEIGVEEHLDALQDVEDSGGRYFVYAARPDNFTDGGNPEQPPPPDTMCPCGGP